MIDAAVIVGGVVALVAAASAYTWWNHEPRRVRRALRRYPRPDLREVRDGDVVRVVGVVCPAAERLVAPLSGLEGPLYVTTVEESERLRKSKHEPQWKQIAVADVGVDFVLDAGRGPRVYVRVVVPRLDVPVVARDESTAFRPLSEAGKRFLASKGESTDGVLLRRRLRIVERALGFGQRVTVSGVARWEPDPDPGAAARAGYRERPMRLRLEAPSDGDMFLSTDPSTMR